MTTYAELQADVFRATNRPDLVSETEMAIRKATLRFHSADKWINDEVVQVVPVTPLFAGDFRYAILTTTFTRFRDLKMLKEYLNPPTWHWIQFEKRAPDDLLDDYKCEIQNYYTRVGNTLTVRAERAMTNLEATYYQFPVVTTAGYSSWIADLYRDGIVREAMLDIFQMTGKIGVDARVRSAEFNDQVSLLRQMAVV